LLSGFDVFAYVVGLSQHGEVGLLTVPIAAYSLLSALVWCRAALTDDVVAARFWQGLVKRVAYFAFDPLQ